MFPPILLDDDLTSPERLSQVSIPARLLYLLLSKEVDQAGRFDPVAGAWSHRLFGDHLTTAEVGSWLDELRDAGFIDYAHFHGERKGFIVGWLGGVVRPVPDEVPAG